MFKECLENVRKKKCSLLTILTRKSKRFLVGKLNKGTHIFNNKYNSIF